MLISKNSVHNTEVLTGENDHIKFAVAPDVGGRIISIYNKELKKEFLWNNTNLRLQVNEAGADYDTHFWGGVDELLPNDIPENINSITYPDHGELWTTPLQYECADQKITVYGKLKLSGLFYKRVMRLEPGSPVIFMEYTIRNDSGAPRSFLWKLHAAMAIEEGDRLVTSAQKARIVYPESSRFNSSEEFIWPAIGKEDVSIALSSGNKTLDFFYLYDIPLAEMNLVSGHSRHLFSYAYDKTIFPYQWYFASYGGFQGHYMAILEPSTGMPVSVNEAMALGQCAVLEPGGEIKTTVRIYAGENK